MANVDHNNDYSTILEEFVVANQYTKSKLEIFEEIQNIAKQKNGICLSQINEYETGKSLLKFKCGVSSHEIWKTTGFSIRISGQWCPLCGQIASRREV